MDPCLKYWSYSAKSWILCYLFLVYTALPKEDHFKRTYNQAEPRGPRCLTCCAPVLWLAAFAVGFVSSFPEGLPVHSGRIGTVCEVEHLNSNRSLGRAYYVYIAYSDLFFLFENFLDWITKIDKLFSWALLPLSTFFRLLNCSLRCHKFVL